MRRRMPFAEKKPGPAVVLLPPSAAREVPWKNGLGITRELASWPENASFERLAFDWRISTAAVEAPGPFSELPGFERILVVVQGAGFALTHGEKAPRSRVRRLEPYLFSGEWPTVAELPHGPIQDLNVIFAPERVDASVQAMALGERRLRESLARGQAFVHALEGGLSVRLTGEEEPIEVPAEHSLLIYGLRGGEELEVVGRARKAELVLVSLAGRESM